jgi:hypothetical protein
MGVRGGRGGGFLHGEALSLRRRNAVYVSSSLCATPLFFLSTHHKYTDLVSILLFFVEGWNVNTWIWLVWM